ncbi:MAG TPA: hypothetical protein VFL17_21960 [Anaerolineae bacterium]|nr:hypothetical protein [Anaerolineae bacterium]
MDWLLPGLARPPQPDPPDWLKALMGEAQSSAQKESIAWDVLDDWYKRDPDGFI